jgi:hypothetical protein
MTTKPLFFPIIDNGMGLSRTSWATCMLAALHGRSFTALSVSYPYPDGAMNLATTAFLESDSDEMVVIDTDIVFSRHHLDCLLSHDEPLVFGIYPKKQPGLTYPTIYLENNPNPFDGDQILCEVACTARGFMRVHRSVFEKMKPHVPSYTCAQTGKPSWEFWRVLQGGHSEDFNFCQLWRSLGGRVLIDKRCATEHEGSARYPIPGTY